MFGILFVLTADMEKTTQGKHQAKFPNWHIESVSGMGSVQCSSKEVKVWRKKLVLCVSARMKDDSSEHMSVFAKF